jgi:hypothetical protein
MSDVIADGVKIDIGGVHGRRWLHPYQDEAQGLLRLPQLQPCIGELGLHFR